MASYERQTWVDLQTPLDAAHMNHIEEGIASIVGITSIKQTTTSTADGGNNVITATLDNGTTETFNIKNGSKGSTGSKGDTGAAGVGIKSVVQTTTSSADGGNNVITVTKTDGTTSTFVVKNGSKGSTGAAGAKGADGYTPVKGVDYWTVADQEAIVSETLTEAGFHSKPDYVVAEAMSVLDKVVAAQGKRTFVLGAITDMHYGSSDYVDGVIHATQGLKHISDRIKLDALAVLGDYTDEHQIDTDTAVTDREECNALLQMIDADRLCMKGNHDHTPGAEAQTFRTIMANSDNVVWGSRIGGYFYRDFDAYKLRIICLNTTEVARDNLSVSDEQYKWFADTLDISAKEDAAEWGILLLSHHPLDWTVTDGTYKFVPIINAYVSGASWTGGAVSCNYASKNDAKIIANIHGHLHNLLTSKMYIGAPGSSAQVDVYRMCTPASRVDYVNHYNGVWKEGTTYSKTKNTANDTAFCVYCIDLDDFTIKAYCYGAGYDRELTYYEKPVEIVNLIDTVGYTDGKRYSASSHGLKDAAGYTCTGEITLAMGDVIRTSGVNFNSNSYQYCNIACINDTTDWTITTGSGTSADMDFSLDASGNLTITPKNVKNNLRIRLTGYGSGANLLVTRNQVI